MDKKYIVELLVGDWSGDGHSQDEKFMISSNISHKEIEEAYTKGSKILGFNLTKDVACDYESSNIDEEHIKSLEKNGFDIYNIDRDEDDYILSADIFKNIWFFVVKLGDPNFEFEEIKGSKINIGGYGLFYC